MADDELRIDIGDLDLGEVEEFEELTGLALSNFGEGKPFPAKALVALVFLTQRRANPAFTLEDARRVHVSSLNYGDRETVGPADPTPLRVVSGEA